MSFPEARQRRGTGRRPSRGGGLVVVGLLAWLLPALAGLFVLPGAAGGQAPSPAELARAEAAYDTALAAYEAILEVVNEASVQHEILVDQVQDARASGDDQRRDAALARAWDHGVQLMRLETRLAEAAEDLRRSGRRLLQLLDARERELLAQRDGAIFPTTRNRIEGEITDLRIRYRAVERQVGSELVTTIRPLPELTIRPTDGRQELQVKASIYEGWAREYEVQLEGLDQEIAVRERRIQQERGREDFLSGLSRFDDDRLTGGGISGTLPERGDAPGSDTPILADMPLAEQVVLLRQLRSRVEELQIEALARARVFRQRAEGGPG